MRRRRASSRPSVRREKGSAAMADGFYRDVFSQVQGPLSLPIRDGSPRLLSSRGRRTRRKRRLHRPRMRRMLFRAEHASALNRMADGPESAHGREGGRDARADRRWLTRVGSAAGAGLSSDGGEKVRGLGLRPSARPTAATTNTGPGAALRPRVRESAADLSDRAGRLLRPAAHGAVAVGPSRTSPARMAAAPASGVEKKAGAGPSPACR